MTPFELAALLNGIEYLVDVSKEIINHAKENNLVIVYGLSDDLIEFRGSIHDEVGIQDGGLALVDSKGLLPVKEGALSCQDYESIKDYVLRESFAKTIKANWDSEGYSWTYETDIPHAIFDVMDEDEKYCRGIVFSMSDLTIGNITPGPWLMAEDGSPFVYALNKAKAINLFWISFHSDYWGVSREELIANARAIHALPDVLHGMINLLHYLKSNPSQDQGAERYIKECDQSIKKALGR